MLWMGVGEIGWLGYGLWGGYVLCECCELCNTDDSQTCISELAGRTGKRLLKKSQLAEIEFYKPIIKQKIKYVYKHTL